MEQYKKYKEVLSSYGLGKSHDRYDVIAKQQRYIWQYMPNMYLIAGMGAFMTLFALGMVIFFIWAIVRSGSVSENPVNYQNLIHVQIGTIILAAVCWFIIGPITVMRARKRNSDCEMAEEIRKMPRKDSLLMALRLNREYLNMRERQEITESVYCEIKDRAVVNKELTTCDFAPLSKDQQTVIDEIDGRLTAFIDKKYAIMKTFNAYLSRDWGKTLMEGFMTSMVLVMFTFMPYLDSNNPLQNPVSLIVPIVASSIAYVGIPFICRWIEYYYPKQAYEHIIQNEEVELTYKTHLRDIQNEYEALLDLLKHEYIIKMAGFMELNAISAKEETEPETGWLDINTTSSDNEKSLYDQIYDHIPYDAQEMQDKETILAFLDCFDNALTRQNVFGHMCASAFVLSADGQKALMLHHKIMNDYIYPGGHADGISDLYSVALREVEEETGLVVEPVVGKKIFSIQAAPVKGHVKNGKFVSAHNHYDVLYLFQAKEEDMKKIRIAENENLAVEWRPLHQTYGEDVAEWARPVIRRIVSKIESMQKNASTTHHLAD